MKNKKSLAILFFISLFALGLRLYKIESLPSFHADEADFANNAYSILKTGRDQDGNFLPLGTTSVGDLRRTLSPLRNPRREAVFARAG